MEEVVVAMAKRKRLECDSITIEFFTKYWNFVGPDFYNMVKTSIAEGGLPT